MNVNTITIPPFFPIWLIILLFFLGLALAFAQYRGIRDKLGKTRARILSFLRLSAISLIVAFALNPSLVTKKEHKISPSVAILVDSSQSMGQSAPGEKITRLDEVRAILTGGASPLLQSLSQKFEVGVYGLADSLRPLESGDLGRLKAGGNKGDLSEVIKALNGKHSVAILLSDGNLKWNGSQSKQLPMLTVAAGSPKTYQDILIKGIKAPALAFRGREVVIDVTIKSYGYTGLVFPVLLKDSEKLLTAKNIGVQDNPGEVTTSFSFVPTAVGQKNLSISVPQQVGESMVTNNQIDLSMKVLRDKTRILMVSGSPSMNYRFMRTALKSDPSIDLLSFVILRTPSDILNVRPQEQSLIPFPVTELFGTELPTFDIVIFQNFNHGPYKVTYFLPQLAEYVNGGGAFLMIGGDLSFGSGGYAATPLEDVLPVRLNDASDLRIQEFRAVPSAAGAGHPVMDLGQANIWERMPPLGLFNQVQSLQPGSLVLLEHPFERLGHQRAPLLVLREVGRGRSAALLTDGAWRWNFVHAGAGGSPRTYHRLFNNLLRWLIQDSGLQAISLRADRAQYLPDEPVRLSIRLHGQSSGAHGRLQLLDAVTRKPIERRTVELDEGGRTELELGPLAPGAYLARFEATDGPGSSDSAEDAFVVAGASRERILPVPRPELLERIAAGTGGRSSDVDRGSLDGIEIDERQRYRVEASTTRPLLGRFWMLAALVLVLAAEWWLRRRWGFA